MLNSNIHIQTIYSVNFYKTVISKKKPGRRSPFKAQAADWTIWDSNPSRANVLFSVTSRQVLWPTQLPISWVRGLKSLGREVGHSSHFNVRLRMSGAIPLLPYMTSLRGQG
jgi:hypothetical protein